MHWIRTLLPWPYLLLGLWGSVASARTPPSPTPLPQPDLSRLEPALAQRLQSLLDQVESDETRQRAQPATHAAAYGELGRRLAAFHVLETAAACFERAIQLQPQAAEWLHLRALVALEQGDNDRAVGLFQGLLDLESGNAPAKVHLAGLLIDQGQLASAKELLQQALGQQESAAAHARLGELLTLQGENERALQHLELALAIQPEADALHRTIAQLLNRTGRNEEARQRLQRAGAQTVRVDDPRLRQVNEQVPLTALEVVADRVAQRDSFAAEDTLSFTLQHLGQVRGAAEALAQQVSLAARQHGLAPWAEGRFRYLLGALWIRQGQEARGVQELVRAAELSPDLADAHLKLGNALARAGRLEEAVRSYENVLQQNADHARAHGLRGAALLELQRPEAAVTSLRRAVALQPADGEARLRLAAATLLLGDEAQFRSERQLLLELPLPPEQAYRLRLRLAAGLQALGLSSWAATEYRECLELRPDDAQARAALAALEG